MNDLLLMVKYILTAVLVVTLYLIWEVNPADMVVIGPQGSAEGIKAGMFALIAGAALFVNITRPQTDHAWNRGQSAFRGLVAAAATTLAAWFWLESETAGGPGGYVYPFVVVGVALSLTAIVPVLWSIFRDRRRTDGKVITEFVKNEESGGATTVVEYQGQKYRLDDSKGCYIEVTQLEAALSGYAVVNIGPYGCPEKAYSQWVTGENHGSVTPDGLRESWHNRGYLTIEAALIALYAAFKAEEYQQEVRAGFDPAEYCQKPHEYVKERA